MQTTTRVRERQILDLHTALRTLEGDGFEVRRAIPSRTREAVGPFIFLDHFGPIEVRPGEAKGASSHPHAGIETLSLLLEGRMQHKDSLGNVSAMGPGEVQWMRAGRGIVHDESPDKVMLREGGRNHGIQLWINIPKGEKHAEPGYRHVTREEVPLLPHDTATVRLIAGQVGDVTGPIETSGHPFVVHASMPEGGPLVVDAEAVAELALYVLTGSAEIAGRAVAPGQIARFDRGSLVALTAGPDSELLLVGGDPLDAPIVRHGPFVMTTVAELEQTFRDYQAGRMGRI